LIDDYVVGPKQLLRLLPIELLYADAPAGNQSYGRSTFVTRPRGAQIIWKIANIWIRRLCLTWQSLRSTSASGPATRYAGRQRAVFGHLADFYCAFVDAHHRITERLLVALSRKSSFRGSTGLVYGSTKSYYGI
jgi:hypothetical protein